MVSGGAWSQPLAMNASPPSRARPARLLASTALLLAVGLVTVGCQTTQSQDPATSAMAAVPPRDDADPRGAAAAWGERHKANPNDPVAAINYAQALRASGQRCQAVSRPGAEPRVRQNLALVVGLQGRFAEAETIARADLPPDLAAANVAYLRQMLAQQNQIKLPASTSKAGRS